MKTMKHHGKNKERKLQKGTLLPPGDPKLIHVPKNKSIGSDLFGNPCAAPAF